jgi:uncharacterized protein YegL
MALKRFDPSAFTTTKPKPLPVILLLDVSKSMDEVCDGSFQRTGRTFFEDGQSWEMVEGGRSRIAVLNEAVSAMIASFAREEQIDREFLVSVITFGSSVCVHLPPTKASRVAWQPLTAAGETHLGEALTLLKGRIEDQEITPSRAYRPVIVLVSDGKPNDEWEAALERFVTSGRSTKCDRMAVAIGADTHEDMLRRFIAGTPNPLFHASDASQILNTFQRITMSVTLRSKSEDPDRVAATAILAPASRAADPPTTTATAPAEAPGAASTTAPAARPSPAGEPEDGYW